MSPKKGYMENGGIFYLGTHLKCAGTVTFILLLTQSWQGEGGGGVNCGVHPYEHSRVFKKRPTVRI